MNGSVTAALPVTVPVQLSVPLPEPRICICPVCVPQEEGLVTVPKLMFGFALTVIVVAAEVAEQPETVLVTLYEPEVFTVMLCVVSPFDHRIPVEVEAVRVTVSLAQMVLSASEEVMLGVAGAPGSLILTESEADGQPSSNVKLYEPAPRPETVAGSVAAIEPEAVPV